jgi:hypothetical protein
MALSKKDLQINITLNEMYNTHSLLQQHIETLVSAKPDRDAYLPNSQMCRLQATSTISAFLLKSLAQPRARFRAKRTAQ